MRSLIAIFIVSFIALPACTSTSGAGAGRLITGADQVVEGVEGAPSKLTPTSEEIPKQVRAIESIIDQPAVILADAIEIHASKNYQFEVSLVGDEVTSDLDRSGVHERAAIGKATAFFRNLRLHGDRGIRVRIADFGTQPFLKVKARGHCSHFTIDEETPGKVTRASAVHIDGAELKFIGRATH